MNNNLPAVINNNEFANSIRSILSAGNVNANNQMLAMRRMFGREGVIRNTDNGAESFFSKNFNAALMKKLDQMNNALSDMGENIALLVGIEEKINKREEEDFYKEQREEAAAKRGSRTNRLLKQILEEIKSLPSSDGFGSDKKSRGFSLLEFLGMSRMKDSIMKMLPKSLIGGGILSSLLSKAGGVAKGAGILGLLSAGVYGAFNAEEISGSNQLSGIRGAGRILGSALSSAMSALTFGLIDSKDMYGFLSETVPDNVVKAFEWAKESAFGMLDTIDRSLKNWLGDNYSMVKGSIMNKFTAIKDGLMNIGSKTFSLMSGAVDTLYDYGLDIINWWEGNQAPELATKKVDYRPHQNKATGIIDRVIEGTTNIASSVTGQTGRNLDITERLGEYAATVPSSVKGGRCYAGVKKILKETGITSDYRSGRNYAKAYQAADIEFKERGFTDLTQGEWQDKSNAQDLINLPKGYIIVWAGMEKDKEGNLRINPNDPGHIGITLGDGTEMSDKRYTIQGNINSDKFKNRYFRVFAPYKSLSGSLSDRADDWALNKIQSAKSSFNSMYTGAKENLKSFMSGGQSLISNISDINTTSADDTRIKPIVSSAQNANTPTVVKEETTAPSVNIVNNNTSQILPQDTSTSQIPFEWVWGKSLLPNRKF